MATRIRPLSRNQIPAIEQDGRILAARMLRYMGRLNAGVSPRNRDSLNAMHRGLCKFRSLTKREQQRFSAVLNEYIGSAMQGIVLGADEFIRESASSLEGVSMRMSNQCLARGTDGYHRPRP